MKSMKMSEQESAEYAMPTAMSGQPLYPWGLQITLDDESLKKLGLSNLPALDEVLEIRCKAQVTGLNSRKEGNDEDESCVILQITDMEVESRDRDVASKLYKEKE